MRMRNALCWFPSLLSLGLEDGHGSTFWLLYRSMYMRRCITASLVSVYIRLDPLGLHGVCKERRVVAGGTVDVPERRGFVVQPPNMI